MSLRPGRWTFLFLLVFGGIGCGGPPSVQPESSDNSRDSVTEAVTVGQDSDEDGLTDEMEAKFGTSPLHADTDGDGFSDYDEVIEYGFDPANDPYKFNPRIADVPQLDIEISKSPQVHFVFDLGEGTQKSIEIGTTTDNSWSTQDSASHGISGSVSGSVGKMAGVTVTAEYSYQISRTTSHENRLSLANMESKASSSDKSTRGGEIMVGVRLHNHGNVQLDVKALRLIALKVPVDAPDRPTHIGQLELDTTRTFDLIAQVKPHASTPDELIFKTALNLSQMEELLKDGSLVIRVADFALSGTEAFTDIGAKTATVVIDPGSGEERSGNTTETYLVAVHSSDGGRGISAAEVLRDVLHLEYETGTTPWNYGDPETPEKLRKGETRSGLRSLMGRVNDYESNGYWVLTHTTHAGSQSEAVEYNPLEADYALDDIRLHSGQILELTYVQDTDRDGLERRTELMLGTDPLVKDTDQDGLTDGEEVVGWTLTTDGAGLTTPRQVRSDPLQEDSDGDGFPDSVEKEKQTHPLRRNIKLSSVVDKTRNEAIKLLEEAGLGHNVTTREDESRPAELVLEQSPPGGAVVEEGAQITLVVSAPPAQVIVPSVVGKQKDEAIKLLKETGLKNEMTIREDKNKPEGVVLEQSVDPGTKVEHDTTVKLVVAKKPPPPDGWIEFVHDGAYVANFKMWWEDDEGEHSYNSGNKTSAYSYKHWFKGKNPRNIHITASAAIFIKTWRNIWDLRFESPPNKTFTAKGSTTDRSYSTK